MNQIRVLLIDDEAFYVDALAERLALRGFETAVAYDGGAGLNRLKEEPFDVVVLDLKMPDMSGIDVLRQMREDGRGHRVFVLTGHGTDEDRDICRALDAEQFINKPINADALSELIKGEKTP